MFDISDDLQALKPRLSSPDAGIRRIALIALADLEEADNLPWLVQALRHDKHAAVRQEAARLLEGWEQPDVIASLCDALSDADAATREQAALSLSEVKTAGAGEVILAWAGHDDTFVRAATLRALRELKLPASHAPALASLDHADAGVRREAVAVLGWLRRQDALAALATLAAGDPDPEVRRAATGALGYAVDNSDILPALLGALNDDVWFVREEAAGTLGKLQLTAAAEALIAGLDDSYWQVRIRAARSLGRIKSPAAVPALLLALQHAISNLRKEAALALGEIGQPGALAGLQAALQDSDPEVRKAVRIALAQLEGQAA